MGEPSLDDLRATWRRLALRNDWALVANENEFLDRVATEFNAVAEGKTTRERIEMAIWRAYGTLLYRGLWHREERAAQELWLAFVRMALRGGQPRPEAEELAQETIARVLDNLPDLRTPQSILSWAMMVFRTVQRGRRKQMPNEQSLQTDDDKPEHNPPDESDLTLEVEQKLTNRELLAQLRARLSNNLERLVLLRIVVFGDKPRDVARDLGLPQHQPRIAKCRALARLREDPDFIAFLRELVGEGGLTSEQRSEGR